MARGRHRAFVKSFVALVAFCAMLFTQNAFAMDFFARTDPESLPATVSDLPLVVTEAEQGAPLSTVFVIWISGDGGWSVLERQIATRIAEAGVPSVAINSFRYFAKDRSPQDTAAALMRIARAFSERWVRDRIIFVGYSFGADTGPSALMQSPELRARFEAALFLSPWRSAFNRRGPASWLGIEHGDDNLTALNSITDLPALCMQGVRDEAAACRAVSNPHMAQATLPAGHTLHGQAPQIAETILELAGLNDDQPR